MRRPPHILHFNGFELDCDNRQLRKHGLPIELGNRYFDALALLVERRGELVSKDAFMETVWQGIPVTDEALTQCVRTLRRALGDDATAPRFIETVPKHGYRFIADLIPQARPIANPLVSSVAGACTIAGLTSGALAGLLYGIVAGIGGGSQVLTLAAMIAALGLLGGGGIGAGLTATITWRGSADWWVIAGATLGGLLVGALGNTLSTEGVGLLSGATISKATGPFEGAILGAATGLIAWTALAGHPRRNVIAAAVLAGGAAAILIVCSGGTLLAGSLHALEKGLPGTQLSMARISMLLGQTGFTQTTRGLTVAMECQIFALAVGIGLLAVRSGPSPAR